MEKSYVRLLTRLHNAPLLMSEEKLRIITEAVTLPLLMQQPSLVDRVPSGTNATIKDFAAAFENNGRKLGIIPVFDSLVSKEVSAGSGVTSYEHINMQIDAAIARGFTDLGFYIDSPGGEATGIFGLTEKIRSLPSRGLRTFSFVDNATSAAYAIAAATQTIYASEIANVGSIAALMVHAEVTKAAEKDGINYTVFRSKELKAIGDPYTELSDAVKEKFTSMLATLDAAFNNDVVKGRSQLSVSEIVAMKGATFNATDGTAAKLVDKIAPNLETAISDYFKKPVTSTQSKGVKMSADIEALTTQLAEANATIAQLKSQHVAELADAAKATETAVLAERARCTEILKTATTLGGKLEVAVKHIEAGRLADDSKTIFEEMRMAHEQSTALDASTGAPATANLQDAGKGDNVSLLSSAYKMATGRV